MAIVSGGAATAQTGQDGPRVVASIAPIHSLVSNVMQGVATPRLLVKGVHSPHTYAMRPSDNRALYVADLLVWVGPDAETFLTKFETTLPNDVNRLALREVEGTQRLEARRGGYWGAERGHNHGASHASIAHDTHWDPHYWLDPTNARIWIDAIATQLGAIDPANAETYSANAARTKVRIDELDMRIKTLLAPVRKSPYVVVHDAFQYFEHRYGLHAVGALLVSDQHQPSAKRLRALRAHLGVTRARCVFYQPQFSKKAVTALVEGTATKASPADPLGARIPTGPDHYFTLLQVISERLAECLAE